MDDDFQQRYRAAELAYGAGDYTEAGRIAGALLNELEATPEDPEAQIAARGWRAFVALLLANVELYGLNHAERAADLYRLVLDNQPHETLAGLAEQGLKRARSIPDEPTPVQQEAPFQQTTPDPVSTGGNLLRDPFLKDQNFSNSSSTSPNQQATAKQQATAMPWVEQLPVSTTPPATVQEPEIPAEPQPTATPVPTSEPAPSPQPDPMELLAGSLLRVKVNLPDAKTSEVESPAESPGASWLQRLLRRR